MSGSITFLTGAGISVNAGIQAFRGNAGAYASDDLRGAFELRRFMSSAKSRQLLWNWMSINLHADASPTLAHHAIAGCYGSTVITQNIDDLHEKAGSRIVHHIHGTGCVAYCYRCGREYHIADVLALVNQYGDALCTEFNAKKNKACGGVIRPGFIMYGENVNRTVWSRSHDAMLLAATVIAVGTSLSVYPAALLMD